MGTPSTTDATSSTNNLGGAEQQIDWEKRFKDTQAAYTKAQQKLKETEAKAKVLEELSKPRVELPKEVAEELDDLKYKDPDAWRLKLAALEQILYGRDATSVPVSPAVVARLPLPGEIITIMAE